MHTENLDCFKTQVTHDLTRIAELFIGWLSVEVFVDAQHWDEQKIAVAAVWRWPASASDSEGTETNNDIRIVSVDPDVRSPRPDRLPDVGTANPLRRRLSPWLLPAIKVDQIGDVFASEFVCEKLIGMSRLRHFI